MGPSAAAGLSTCTWRYLEVDPPTRVSFTWCFTEPEIGVPPGSTTVEITLHPIGSGTRLELVHRGLPITEAKDHDQGWSAMLDRLARTVKFSLRNETRNEAMTEDQRHLASPVVVKSQMLIRRPVSEPFSAFIDPDITTRFWFTKSSGRLEPGAEVEWTWEMYNASGTVSVKEVEPNSRIVIDWGEPPRRSSGASSLKQMTRPW